MCDLWDPQKTVCKHSASLPDICALLCDHCPEWILGTTRHLCYRKRERVRWCLSEYSPFFSLPMAFVPKSKIKVESNCLTLPSSLIFLPNIITVFQGFPPSLFWSGLFYAWPYQKCLFLGMSSNLAKSWLNHEEVLRQLCFYSCFPNKNHRGKIEQNYTCFLHFQQKKLME